MTLTAPETRSTPLGAEAVERGVRGVLATAERCGAPWAAALLAAQYAFLLGLGLAEPETNVPGGTLRLLVSTLLCAALAAAWFRKPVRWPPGAVLVLLAAIVLVNTLARSFVGPHPWIGTRLAILAVAAALIAPSWRSLGAVLAAGLATWTVTVALAPPEPVWHHQSAFLVFACGLSLAAYYIRLRTVRDLVRSREALARSHDHLSRAQKIAGVASFEWDLERDTLTWSDQMQRFGAGERGGSSLASFLEQVVHPEDRELARDLVAFCSRADSAFQREVRLLGPDGTVRWIEAHGVSMRNALGRTVVVGALIDRTEQREAAAREAELLRALARRDHASMLGEVTAMLAHELRHPLAAIANYADGGARRLADGATADAGEALRAIGEEARRAADIVRTVIDASPRSAAASELVEVGDVATQIARLVDLEARERGVKVRVRRELNPAHAFVNPTQLAQVLSNLLRNALDAIAEQGASTGEIAVHVKEGERGWIEVSVCDSGKGVSPDRAEAVFAPFFTTKVGGTGLGLAVSRRLVEAFGGRLWTEPGANGGTFRFTLPRALEASPRE